MTASHTTRARADRVFGHPFQPRLAPYAFEQLVRSWAVKPALRYGPRHIAQRQRASSEHDHANSSTQSLCQTAEPANDRRITITRSDNDESISAM